MYTILERGDIIKQFDQEVKKAFPQVHEYNVIIFGSFLSEEYSQGSDIDIAVFSLNSILMRKLYWFTVEYFERLNIDCDVIEIRLSDSQYIAVNAILDHKYEITDYVPEELIKYIKNMVRIYGNNPMKYSINKLCEEVESNGSSWR